MYWWPVAGVLSPDLRCLNKKDRCLKAFRSFKKGNICALQNILNWVLRVFFFLSKPSRPTSELLLQRHGRGRTNPQSKRDIA